MTVRTTSPQGHTVILGPDDDLPAWAFDVIDHPRAWEGGVVPAKPEPAAEVEPAKPAASASEADWRAYALANGKTETDLDGLGRNDIRDLFA